MMSHDRRPLLTLPVGTLLCEGRAANQPEGTFSSATARQVLQVVHNKCTSKCEYVR